MLKMDWFSQWFGPCICFPLPGRGDDVDLFEQIVLEEGGEGLLSRFQRERELKLEEARIAKAKVARAMREHERFLEEHKSEIKKDE